jgi:hypothetical protein
VVGTRALPPFRPVAIVGDPNRNRGNAAIGGTWGAMHVLVLIVIGLDPIAGIYGANAGIAAIGMMLLMLLTSLAVVTFFRRTKQHTVGRVRGLLIPLAATAGLLFCLILICTKFTVVTGASPVVSLAQAMVPVLGGLAGLALALRAGAADRFLRIDDSSTAVAGATPVARR